MVPIWFIFTSTAFAAPVSIPRTAGDRIRCKQVVPDQLQSCNRAASVSSRQPSQSSSSSPSSIEAIGYFAVQLSRSVINSLLVSVRPSVLNVYFPFA